MFFSYLNFLIALNNFLKFSVPNCPGNIFIVGFINVDKSERNLL